MTVILEKAKLLGRRIVAAPTDTDEPAATDIGTPKRGNGKGGG